MGNSIKFLILMFIIRLKQIVKVSIEVALGRVTYYPNSVKFFEKNFAKFSDSKHSLMFTNATSALEAALFSLGVKYESKVGTVGFVIPSSYSSAFNLGAKIEFFDIDVKTLNIDYDSLIKSDNPSIDVLIVVHFYGNPCDMELIMNWANKHDIKVLEDCSHAHGAEFKNKKVGTWGDVGVFSLQGAKSVSAGEGAIAITNSDKYYSVMAAYGHQESYKKFKSIDTQLKLPSFGFGKKMRIHPLGAVLANIDFSYLEQKNKIFSEWFKEMEVISEKSDYFSIQKVDCNSKIAGYAQGLVLILNNKNDADLFTTTLKKQGINNFRRNYLEHIEYFSTNFNIENTITSFDTVVFIPFYQFIDFRRWKRLKNILKAGK